MFTLFPTQNLSICVFELKMTFLFLSNFRSLHEQSDRAVSEAQNRIRQLENELAEARGRLGSVHSTRDEQGQQVINLKQDINTLKRNLAQLESEKDEVLVCCQM